MNECSCEIAAPSVGALKGRCWIILGFTRKTDTISKVIKPWYKYWVGGVAGLRCENWQVCWTVSAFQFTKILLQTHFWQSKKKDVGRTFSSLLPVVNLKIHASQQDLLSLRSEVTATHVTTYLSGSCILNSKDCVSFALRHLQMCVFQLYHNYKKTNRKKM